MTMRTSRLAGALMALAAAAVATSPAAAAAPCLSTDEAEALVLAVAPDLIRQTGVQCATELPPNALLRRPSSSFLSRFQAEADSAWPRARTALAKLAGPDVQPLLESGFARTLLGSLVAPLLQVQTGDCGAVNRLVTLLEPLPPRNAAAVVVTVVQLSEADRQKRGLRPSGLPICTGARP